MPITTSKQEVYKALEEIKQLQTGVIKVIKTRRSHFNDNLLGGLYPNSIISIGGLPGTGKSWSVQEIEEDMFNRTLNPHCDNLYLIRCNFEMTVRGLFVRRLSKSMNMDIDDILLKKQTEENENRIREIAKKECNDHIFYYSDQVDPETFEKDMEAFLIDVKKKNPLAHTVITIDHIAMIKAFGSKKEAIDNLIERLNNLKKKYLVTFIILSQLNREIKKRSANPMEHAPRTDDFYQSDTIYQISDFQIVIHRPELLGIDWYMAWKTGKVKYEWLEGYMNPDKTSFKTKGLIFWHYLKFRDRSTKNPPKELQIEVLPGYENSYYSRSGGTFLQSGPPISFDTYVPPEEDIYR